MDQYKINKSINHKIENPFLEILDAETKICDVNISEYSHINKVLSYALRKCSHKDVDVLMLMGQDKAIPKTEKVANIMMTKVNNLHRCDANAQKQHEDVWIPQEENSLLDELSVIRNVPVKFILLAKDKLPEKIRAHPSRLQIYGAEANAKVNLKGNKKIPTESNNNHRNQKNNISYRGKRKTSNTNLNNLSKGNI